MLGRGGWERGVSASRGLGGPGSVGGGSVDGGGGSGANAVRAKAGEKGGNIVCEQSGCGVRRSQEIWKRWGGLCSGRERKGKRQEI
jgi:hypothetical protein